MIFTKIDLGSILMSEESKLKECYNLIRHTHPSKIETRLFDTIDLAPDLEEDLLTTIDTPLKLVKDEITKGQFIACEFNRDLDSHRSPFSNQYFPPLEDGTMIPDRLRQMEIKANAAFAAYTRLYFMGGISSVYLWEISDDSFGIGIFIKNEVETILPSGEKVKGCIDCSDTVEVIESKPKATYKLTSSAIVTVSLEVPGLSQPLTVSGNIADNSTARAPWSSDDSHIVNVGQLVEKKSGDFKSMIDNIFVGKLNEIKDILANNDGRAQQAFVEAVNAELSMKTK